MEMYAKSLVALLFVYVLGFPEIHGSPVSRSYSDVKSELRQVLSKLETTLNAKGKFLKENNVEFARDWFDSKEDEDSNFGSSVSFSSQMDGDSDVSSEDSDFGSSVFFSSQMDGDSDVSSEDSDIGSSVFFSSQMDGNSDVSSEDSDFGSSVFFSSQLDGDSDASSEDSDFGSSVSFSSQMDGDFSEDSHEDAGVGPSVYHGPVAVPDDVAAVLDELRDLLHEAVGERAFPEDEEVDPEETFSEFLRDRTERAVRAMKFLGAVQEEFERRMMGLVSEVLEAMYSNKK